jgi:hypothetical protein
MMRSDLGKCRHIDIKLLWIQEVSTKANVMIKPVGSLETVADLGTKFLEKARLERLRHEVHLEAPEKDVEVKMVTEDPDDDPSLSLMEMTIPMLVILAVIGLITASDEDELRTTTISVIDFIGLSASYEFYAHIQGGVKIIKGVSRMPVHI